MAYKLREAAQARWRAVNAPHLVALVRAGATFVDEVKVEREDQGSAARPSAADLQLLTISLMTAKRGVSMSITSVMAVVTVEDFDGGLDWYQRFFGRPADLRPMDGLAEWHLTKTGVVQLVYDSDRGGSGLLTLGVEDLDGTIAELARRGLTVGEVTEGVIARIASISDPEGNTITFAQLYGSDA